MKAAAFITRNIYLESYNMPITLTLEELKNLIGEKTGLSHSYVVGKQYLIRTVTFFYTGKLESVTDSDLVLSTAAWIADTGRFHECLKTGKLNEIEPFVGHVIVPRAAVIDATEWLHPLPESVK